jgi:D-alanyl-D-alanine dipeptidase
MTIQYKDLVKIKVVDNGELLVNVNKYDPTIEMIHENQEMSQYTGDNILVRDSVAKKLANINNQLINGEKLLVVFGYRHPNVQKLYFDIEKKRISCENPDLSKEDLIEKTHIFNVVPDVAGHPCGAAVDITIVDKNGQKLDMGTGIADFNSTNRMAVKMAIYSDKITKIADFDSDDKIPTYSNKITKKQLENRLKLHDLMVSENFAPFYEEWWHFSYGDREWAVFYEEPNAIYKQITL